MSQIIVYALQQTFPRYWTPFYNLEKRLIKRAEEEKAQQESQNIQKETKRLHDLTTNPIDDANNDRPF